MPKVLITEEMFKNMPCDDQTTKQTNVATGETFKPSVQIVFANSDINAALLHLVKSLESPFNPNAVATILVQESINRRFHTKTATANGNLNSSLPTGIVTLHTFRTAKEAIALANKESIKFETVSIWHENHSYAYEIVAALKSSYYFINCFKDPAVAIKEGNYLQNKNCVSVDKSYHYESLDHEGVHKFIVFPIGSIFAN
ncbi:hypothetical protein DOY81_014062 [Sarcophaga bullata]|nr:hypothetical protein DOY81_014062 [Sarcophaga bullata]